VRVLTVGRQRTYDVIDGQTTVHQVNLRHQHSTNTRLIHSSSKHAVSRTHGRYWLKCYVDVHMISGISKHTHGLFTYRTTCCLLPRLTSSLHLTGWSLTLMVYT